MRKIIMVSAALMSVAVMSSSRAATITTDLGDWESAVAQYRTTTSFGFDDNTSTGSVNLVDGQSLGITDGATVYSGPNFNSWNLSGVDPTSGQVVEVDFLNETITFSPKITALGFIVQPLDTQTASILVQLSDGTEQSISTNFTDSGSTQFIGFYDGVGVDSISLSFGQGPGEFAFANVVDSAVPEPMSMALLLTAMTGLGIVRRRHS